MAVIGRIAKDPYRDRSSPVVIPREA